MSLDKGKLRAKTRIALALVPSRRGDNCIIHHASVTSTRSVPTITRGIENVRHNAILTGNGSAVSAVRRYLTTLCTLNVSGYHVRYGTPRFPVLSNDTTPFIRTVGRTNVRRRGTSGRCFRISRGIIFASPSKGSAVAVLPSHRFSLRALVNCPSSILPGRCTILSSLSGFRRRVTPYHAFMFIHRVRTLIGTNLVGNNSLDGTVMVCSRPITTRSLGHVTTLLKRATPRIDRLNCVGNSLQFSGRPTHRGLLSLVNSLTLLNVPVHKQMVTRRPKRNIGATFTGRLHGRHDKTPIISVGTAPVVSVGHVGDLLPRHCPFLLISGIVRVASGAVVAIGNVAFGRVRFVKRFPSRPIVPNILRIRTVTRSIKLLILSRISSPGSCSACFLGVSGIGFHRGIIPNSVVVVGIVLASPVHHNVTAIGNTYCIGNGITYRTRVATRVTGGG